MSPRPQWYRRLTAPLLGSVLAGAAFLHFAPDAAGDPGLVAHWTLNGDGTDLVSGNTLVPTSIEYVPGRLGPAADIANPGAKLEAPSRPEYGITGSGFTVECWVRLHSHSPPEAHNPMFVFCGREDEYNLWTFGFCKTQCPGDQGRLIFGSRINGTDGPLLIGASHVDDWQWHHVAATYDGSQLRLYLDGALDAGSSVQFAVDVSVNSALRLGQYVGGRDQYDGAIDEVRIWSVARTQAEIQASIELAPPASPSHCTAIPVACTAGSSIEVRWTNVANETGYDLYRDQAWIASTAADVTLLVDTPPAGPHVYSVRAVNSLGPSAGCEATADNSGGANWVANGVRLHPWLDTIYYSEADDYSVIPDGSGGAIVVRPDPPSAQRVTPCGQVVWPGEGTALTPPETDHPPTVAGISDGNGGAIAAWGRYSGRAQRIDGYGERPPSWPAPGVPLVTRSLNDHARPEMAPDAAGGAFVAVLASDYDVLLQRVTASGIAAPPPWPAAGLEMCSGCGYAQNRANMDLAADGSGGALIVWATGIEVRIQRITASSALAAGWPAGGVVLAYPNDPYDLWPAIVGDGNGNAIVAINDYPEVRAYRVRPDGTLDPSWPSGGRALGPPGDRVALASDGAGGAIAAWIAYEAAYEVRAQHVGATGAIVSGWPAQGKVLSTMPTDARYGVSIAEDGEGGAFFVWDDSRNSVYLDIYAQHLTGGGAQAPGWESETGGRLICGARGYQVGPSVAHVGSGRAIIAWTDYRDGYYEVPFGCPNGCVGHVYAQIDEVPGVLDPNPEPVAVRAGRPGRLAVAVRPNPAAAEVSIDLELPSAGPVRVTILDVTGRAVRTLERAARLAQGRHLTWDGRNDAGLPVASGIYLVHVQAAGERSTRRISLVR